MAGVLLYSAANKARLDSDYEPVLLNSAGAALTADTGYDPDHLVDGKGESAWRSPTAATSHRITVEHSVGAGLVSCAGAFDVVPVSPGVTVVAVRVQIGGTTTGPWTDRAVLVPNGRGDWARCFAPMTEEIVSYLFELSSSSKLDIGELFHGVAAALPTNAARIRRRSIRATNVNESKGGTRWRAKFAKERLGISLPFAPLTETQDAAVTALVDAADGALGDVLLFPLADRPTEHYLGGIEDATEAEEDPSGLRSGRSVEFVESGRSL